MGDLPYSHIRKHKSFGLGPSTRSLLASRAQFSPGGQNGFLLGRDDVCIDVVSCVYDTKRR